MSIKGHQIFFLIQACHAGLPLKSGKCQENWKKLWNFKIREIGGNPVMNFDLERR